MAPQPLRVLVTGAAKRIGSEICRILAAQKAGHIVLHFDRSRHEAQTLARELLELGAGKVTLMQADLERFSDIQAFGHKVLAAEPGLNSIVFNAGIYEKTPFGTVSEDQWNRHFDINLKSVFFLAQHLGLHMKTKGSGRIVLIGDWAGLKPYAQYIPYSLSKTGMLFLTHALAKALAPQVQVNAVLPGPVLMKDNVNPREIDKIKKAALLKTLGSAEAVAKAVRFFLQEADYSTGAWLTVDGGRLIA